MAGLQGASRAELNLANKVNTSVGSARFSAPAFGHYLYAESMSDGETDKVMIAFFYFLQACANESDTERSRLAGKLLNTLAFHEYVVVD